MGLELDPSQRGVVEAYNQGLPVRQIATEHSYSESTVNRVVKKADALGIEVKRRPRGRPPIDRDSILEQFGRSAGTGHSDTEAVIYAASMAGCSLTTVFRARRGK